MSLKFIHHHEWNLAMKTGIKLPVFPGFYKPNINLGEMPKLWASTLGPKVEAPDSVCAAETSAYYYNYEYSRSGFCRVLVLVSGTARL